MPFVTENLDALRQRTPEIAEGVGRVSLPEDAWIDVTESGLPTLTVRPANGTPMPVYPGANPRVQASGEIHGLDFRAEDATLFVGFGLGYHLDAIVSRMEIDHQIFVVEPCPELFRLALGARDLRPLLSHERVHVFVGRDLEPLRGLLEFHLMRLVAGHLHELVLDPLVRGLPRAYEEILDGIEKILIHLRLSYRHYMGEHAHAGNHELLRNLLLNAARLGQAAEVKGLFGLLRGKPAIVISGGPSLDKNMHLLKDAEGKACVIAVDTALKPLLNEGIQPDIVVSSDPCELNERKFSDLPTPLGIPLLFHPGVSHGILDRFQGATFVTGGTDSLSKWILDCYGMSGDLTGGTSTAHIAFALARAMEADPIIFVGLDLSFPDQRDHVTGAARIWAPAPDQAWVWVPDVHGGKVKTLPGFQAMIGLFEAEISKTRSRCIDATEGGARIKGTHVMTLKSALDTFVSQRPRGLRRLIEIHPREETTPRKAPAEALASLFLENTTTKILCLQALPLIRKALAMVAAGAFHNGQFAELAREIGQLDAALGEKRLFKEVLLDFQARLLMYQYLQGYKIMRARSPQDSLRFSLESIERVFESFSGLADVVDHWLKRVLNRIPQGLFCVGPQDRALFFNDPGRSLLGYDTPSGNGVCLKTLFPPGEDTRLKHELAARIAPGDNNVRRLTSLVLSKNGTPVAVSIAGIPLFESGTLRAAAWLFEPFKRPPVTEEPPPGPPRRE